jgi:hypothetical protein
VTLPVDNWKSIEEIKEWYQGIRDQDTCKEDLNQFRGARTNEAGKDHTRYSTTCEESRDRNCRTMSEAHSQHMEREELGLTIKRVDLFGLRSAALGC